jgi:hypothetical protein
MRSKENSLLRIPLRLSSEGRKQSGRDDPAHSGSSALNGFVGPSPYRGRKGSPIDRRISTLVAETQGVRPVLVADDLLLIDNLWPDRLPRSSKHPHFRRWRLRPS